jgi:uncharacterized protein YkwD
MSLANLRLIERSPIKRRRAAMALTALAAAATLIVTSALDTPRADSAGPLGSGGPPVDVPTFELPPSGFAGTEVAGATQGALPPDDPNAATLEAFSGGGTNAAPAPPAPAPAAAPAPAPPPASTAGVRADIEGALVGAINGQRAAHGLPALSVSGSLTSIARTRSQNMISGGYFGHAGGEVFDLLAAAGIGYSWAGENISRNNYPDSETVAVAIRDLMASAAHRDNILFSGFSRIGVGCVSSGDMKYCTMVFVG